MPPSPCPPLFLPPLPDKSTSLLRSTRVGIFFLVLGPRFFFHNSPSTAKPRTLSLPLCVSVRHSLRSTAGSSQFEAFFSGWARHMLPPSVPSPGGRLGHVRCVTRASSQGLEIIYLPSYPLRPPVFRILDTLNLFFPVVPLTL